MKQKCTGAKQYTDIMFTFFLSAFRNINIKQCHKQTVALHIQPIYKRRYKVKVCSTQKTNFLCHIQTMVSRMLYGISAESQNKKSVFICIMPSVQGIHTSVHLCMHHLSSFTPSVNYRLNTDSLRTRAASCAKIWIYSLFYLCNYKKIQIHTVLYLWNYIKSARQISFPSAEISSFIHYFLFIII